MGKIKYHSAEAVKELKKLVDEFVNLKNVAETTGTNSAISLSKIEGKLTSLQLLTGKTNASLNRLSKSIELNTKSNTKNSKALEYQLKLGNTYNKQISDNTKKNIKNSNSIKKLSKNYSSLFKVFGAFLSLNLFKNLALTVFEMAKDFDSLRFSMETISDTAFDLASSQRFLLKITEDYGVELLATSQRYTKFLAAAKQSNLSLNDTEKIFGSVTKAASVLGLKTDELTGVYLALEQMLSKGKVTTEELRRQLGERLPGAMGIMAAALDVTIPKLDEMLRKGEVMSAEALPKFAEALEAAYGIEAVKKVDTLVAAQNRMSNTWQTWIQDITKGDGVFSQFIKRALNGITNVIKKLGGLTGSNDLQIQNLTVEADREVTTDLENTALERVKSQGIEILDFSKKISDKRNAILLAGSKKKEAILEDELRVLVKNQIKQNKAIEAAKKVISKERLGLAISNFETLSADNKKSLEIIKKREDEITEIIKVANNGRYEEHKKTFGDTKAYQIAQEAQDKLHKGYVEGLKKRIEEEKKYLKTSNADLAFATAQFDVYRKQLQESDVTVLPVKPRKTTKTPKIDVSDLDLKIEKIKNSIKNLDYYMSLPTTGIQERLDSIKTMLNLENDLITVQYEKEIRLSRKHKTKEEIASEKHQQKELDIKRKWDAKKIKMEQEFFKKGLDEIKAQKNEEKNIEINALREKFNKLGTKSKEAVKKFRQDEKDINRKFNNETILEQVEFLRQWMQLLNIHGEERVELERKIQELLTKLKSDFKVVDERTWQDDLLTIKEFLSNVEGLFNAVFERRIANIEAEIRAEEDKYDRLIELAHDDEAQKAALEKQKEDKVKQLEKKKLKERQKQAKIQKAFAIADIAINTAISVAKVWGQTGIFGIAAQIPVLIMGALQTAAVLAAPIPQYKDGIDSVPENQIAMINDGGKKEYVERDGKILSTNTKNAIVSLKKNDTVYKDYNDMAKSSKIYSIISNGEILSQNEFDKLSNVIENSIGAGFKKAKINNKVVLRSNSDSSYLNEKARFNG